MQRHFLQLHILKGLSLQNPGVPDYAKGEGNNGLPSGGKPALWEKRIYPLHLLGGFGKEGGKPLCGRRDRTFRADAKQGLPEGKGNKKQGGV